MTKTVLKVNDIDIDVVKKNIKNIHLAVYPPDARVRISAPYAYDDETLRLFAVSKLAWIKNNIEIISKQRRVAPKDYVSGESHYLFGKRYLLKVIEGKKASIHIQGVNHLVMTVRNNTSRDSKQRIMNEWYKEQLEQKLNILIPKWENITNLHINDWCIKRMKTRWGSCNIDKRKIILNLELAKRPFQDIEYVILHELSHLVERTHNSIFTSHVEKYMPNWEIYKRDLNSITFEE